MRDSANRFPARELLFGGFQNAAIAPRRMNNAPISRRNPDMANNPVSFRFQNGACGVNDSKFFIIISAHGLYIGVKAVNAKFRAALRGVMCFHADRLAAHLEVCRSFNFGQLGLPVESALTTEYRKKKVFYARLTLRRCLRITAVLECPRSSGCSSRHPAPMRSRYETHLDTPSLKPESQRSLACPMPKRTR